MCWFFISVHLFNRKWIVYWKKRKNVLIEDQRNKVFEIGHKKKNRRRHVTKMKNKLMYRNISDKNCSHLVLSLCLSSRWPKWKVNNNNKKKDFKRRWPTDADFYQHRLHLHNFSTLVKYLRWNNIYIEWGIFLHAQTKVNIYHVSCVCVRVCSGQWSDFILLFYIHTHIVHCLDQIWYVCIKRLFVTDPL